MRYRNLPKVESVTIPAGETVSDAVDTDQTLVGIVTPTNLDGTTMGLSATLDGETWSEVYLDDNELYQVDLEPGMFIVIPFRRLLPLHHFRVTIANTQAEDITIKLTFCERY